MTDPRVPALSLFLWGTAVFALKPASGLAAAIRLAQTGAGAPADQNARQIVINLGGKTLRIVLSTSVLGFAVILVLTLLLTIAVILAIVARRKTKHLEAANRQLEREIAERERSEEELRRATEMVQAVAETAPLAISAIDLDGRVTFWNPAAEQLFGWPAAEVMGQPLPVIPGDHRREFETRLKLYKQKRALRSAEVNYQRRDGTCFEASLWTAPLTNSDGQVLGMLGITADITERKQATEKVRVSELRFRQLADSMPQIVWTAGRDGSIDYINQRWFEFSGYTPSTHLTEDMRSMIHSDDLDRFLRGWEAAVGVQEPYEAECRLTDRHSGGYRWFLCRGIPVRDSVTNSIRWFGTFTDIHQQKRIEAGFRRANEDLNRFAYSTNHDLQEPLRNMSSYSQLLEKRYGGRLDAEAKTFIRYIAQDAQRMCVLIRNLTVYTSAGNPSELFRASCDANIAIGKALVTLQVTVSDNQALVVYSDLPQVRMAEEDLQQIFEILVQNAIQYRKAGVLPRIDITARLKGAEWIFSVQDNGIGIPTEYRQQIFEVFGRLHGASRYGSTGMGLPICQKIVEHNGGSIWVGSPPEAGSIFHFSVPALTAIEMISKQQERETQLDVQ